VRAWASIHVYYYQDQDGLILDAVRPLFARLGEHGVRAYFERHWRQGPHLRLNVQASAQEVSTLVLPAVEEIVGGYLRAHPSVAEPDPERLLPSHERLAELEAESGPLLPWYPDNSIQQAAYGGRVSVLGSQQAVELLADYYVDSTPVAFQMIERVRQRGTSRLAGAFDLMVATAQAFSPDGIIRGFLSFRSHAEAFLNAWPEGQDLRPHWDRHYTQHADTLAARVRAVIAELHGQTGSAGEAASVIDHWVRVMTPFPQRAQQLLAAGLTLGLRPAADQEQQHEEKWNDLTAQSPFHRALVAAPSWAEVEHADWFLRYRLVLNYMYLHFTRLGLTPTERFLLCHLTANAVEDCYGISAMEQLASPELAEQLTAREIR
jgi:Lantibiotic biosynthesis dehydratase C-term